MEMEIVVEIAHKCDGNLGVAMVMGCLHVVSHDNELTLALYSDSFSFAQLIFL